MYQSGKFSTQDLGLQLRGCLMALAHKDLLLQLPNSLMELYENIEVQTSVFLSMKAL